MLLHHLVWRVFAGLLLAVTTLIEPASAALPTGFSDTLVVDVEQPASLAFAPGGRILIATQPGQLYIYQDGALLSTPAVDLSLDNRLCTNLERGLLGVAVDPSFTTNRFIYLYYTFNKSGICPMGALPSPDAPVNRVARFTLVGNGINLASETVLVDNIPSVQGNHAGGDLHFGKDGYLHISVGDGGCDYAGNSGCAGLNNASRDPHVLLGKILRITRDGGIPPGNPFTDAGSGRCNKTGRTRPGMHCQETFAMGLRNPFRIAFDPNATGTRFFINDVGQGHWGEIDAGKAGADYGWNVREGPCTANRPGRCPAAPPQFTDPIHAYNTQSELRRLAKQRSGRRRADS